MLKKDIGLNSDKVRVLNQAIIRNENPMQLHTITELFASVHVSHMVVQDDDRLSLLLVGLTPQQHIWRARLPVVLNLRTTIAFCYSSGWR